MSSPEDLLPGLESRLLDIPEDKFVEVVRLLERVRDHPDIRQTFSLIRPRLTRIRPERRPTLKRILCMPFEDVLESFGGIEVPLGRIERRVIEPVWRIVEETVDQHAFDQLDRQVQEIAPGNRNAQLNLGRRLWLAAAQALRKALDEDSGKQLLWRRFHGDEDLVRQAREVAIFLEIGPIVESLKADLSPKPLPALEAEHIAAIEQAIQTAASQSVANVYYILLLVASRLATPADLLTILHDLNLGKARKEQPVLFAQLSGLVVSNLEERTARFDHAETVRHLATPEAAIEIAERLIASVDTTNAVMDLLSEPIYRERLQAVRTAVRDMVQTSVLDTATSGILAAMPPPGAAGIQEVDEDAQQTAEDHARALRRCEALADSLDLRKPVEEALKSMTRGIAQRANALLIDYPRTAGNGDASEAAELNLFYALRLLEMVAGPSKAEELRQAILATIGEMSPGSE